MRIFKDFLKSDRQTNAYGERDGDIIKKDVDEEGGMEKQKQKVKEKVEVK